MSAVSRKTVSFSPLNQMTIGGSWAFSVPQSQWARDRGGPSRASTLSVEDIFTWAEDARANSSRQSRRSTVEMVQSYMFCDPSRLSRPQTSTGRGISPERPYTPRSLYSEPPAPVTTPVAWTADDETDDEMSEDAGISSLSQQCCEILGPSMCRECGKTRRTQRERSKYESSFRSLRVSQENFTTAALVKKNMPHLSLAEIQDNVASGKVSQLQMRRLHEVRENPDEIEKRRRDKERKEREAMIIRNKPKSSYNLREMNRRLAEGDTGFRKKKATRLAVTESLFPTFVSPRKVKQYEAPQFRVFYDPPIVAKHKQKAEPTFFAGSSFDYKLPDRLPDKIIFMKEERQWRKLPARSTTRPRSPAEPLEYEATFIDSVDNLIKEHLER